MCKIQSKTPSCPFVVLILALCVLEECPGATTCSLLLDQSQNRSITEIHCLLELNKCVTHSIHHIYHVWDEPSRSLVVPDICRSLKGVIECLENLQTCHRIPGVDGKICQVVAKYGEICGGNKMDFLDRPCERGSISKWLRCQSQLYRKMIATGKKFETYCHGFREYQECILDSARSNCNSQDTHIIHRNLAAQFNISCIACQEAFLAHQDSEEYPKITQYSSSSLRILPEVYFFSSAAILTRIRMYSEMTSLRNG